jgi:hypothetical protein
MVRIAKLITEFGVHGKLQLQLPEHRRHHYYKMDLSTGEP